MDRAEIVALLLPVITSALVASAASIFRTSRRLRSELEQETAIAERLPRGVGAQLRGEIRRRTMLLVALDRFPPFTRTDAFSLVGMILTLLYGALLIDSTLDAAQVFEAPAIVMGAALLGGVYARCWGWLSLPWSWRAARRIRFLDKHLGRDDAREVAFMVRIGLRVIQVGGAAGIAVLLGALAFVGSHQYGRPLSSRQ